MIRRKRLRKRVREHVSGHQRRKTSGRGMVSVSSYDRKAKPKHIKYIKPFKRSYDVRYFRDNQGRIVAKRIYKPL